MSYSFQETLYDGGLTPDLGQVRFKLDTNENCLGMSHSVREKLINHSFNLSRYPDRTYARLKNKIADYHDIQIEGITVGAGSWSLLDLIAKVFQSSHGITGIFKYGFQGFYYAAKKHNHKIYIFEEPDYFDRLRASEIDLPNGLKLIFIANPGNPTGIKLTTTQLTDFVKSLANDTVLVVDEAYIEYTEDHKNSSALKLVKSFPNVIVVRTFSKIYGLAGFRVGWCYSSPRIAGYIQAIELPYGLTDIAQEAAIFALEEHKHVETSRAYNMKARERIEKCLKELEFSFISSQANFIAADFSKYPRTPEKFKKLGLLYRNLAVYNMPGWMRLTIGCDAANELLIEGINHLRMDRFPKGKQTSLS